MDVEVTQADRDLRDALEHCAHMDKIGNGFLTDDALPILAAARIAAEALSRHKAAGEAMAEAISAFVTRWECGDQEAVSVANRMTDALTAWNSIGADRD